MGMLIIFVMVQLGTMAFSRAHTTEAPHVDVRDTISDMVDELCPKTDICAANATNAELKPNSVVSFGRTSCCQGCSCHPDCKAKNNCCYPDDYGTVEISTTPKYQSECLYTRLGRTEYLNALVPAFDTIVSPPDDRCLDRTPVRVSENVILEPTCDNVDVTPFGWYFPVYSKQTGEIYKNILCARCHGVRDVESFQPMLVCKKTDKKTKILTSLTDSLGILETRALSPRCYIDFKFKDISALRDKRCYKDVINNCTTDSISPPLHQRSFSVNFGVILNLCESSFNAPTVNVIDGNVYKNVFCSLCGKASEGVVLLFCIDQFHRKPTDEHFTFFMDPRVVHTIDKAPKGEIKSEICLNQLGSGKICRRIYCSTGKVRNGQDECVLIGNFLGATEIRVEVKLISKKEIAFDGNDFKAKSKRLAKAILRGNHWPKYWTINLILNVKDINVCDEKAVVVIHLSTIKESTEMIYRDIENSINNPWTIDWMNETVILEQSFSEYKIVSTVIDGKIKYLPSWQIYQTNTDSEENIFDCGHMEWILEYKKAGRDMTVPVLKKLFFCNQILLQPDEIILGPENTYLTSNLTKRALHDNEFDLIEDADGFTAMVCLDDTIFATNKTNGANNQPRLELTVVILVFLVYSM